MDKSKLKKITLVLCVLVLVLILGLILIKSTNKADIVAVRKDIIENEWEISSFYRDEYDDVQKCKMRLVFLEDGTYFRYNVGVDKKDEITEKYKYEIKENFFGALKLYCYQDNRVYTGDLVIENQSVVVDIDVFDANNEGYKKISAAQVDTEEKQHVSEDEKETGEASVKEKIKVVDITCNSSVSGSGYFTTISGKICNTSENSYSKVVVNISMYDSSGSFIGNTTKTINDNITPGSTIAFLRTTQTKSRITKAFVSVRQAIELPGNAVKDSNTNTINTTKAQTNVAGNAHIHRFTIDATCEEPAKCVCGATTGEARGHNWKEATCEDPKICTICLKTEGKELGHISETATCEENEVCKRCQLVVRKSRNHYWQIATCTKPMFCERCGVTSGSPIPHNYDYGSYEVVTGQYCIWCDALNPEYPDTSKITCLAEENEDVVISNITLSSARYNRWDRSFYCDISFSCVFKENWYRGTYYFDIYDANGIVKHEWRSESGVSSNEWNTEFGIPISKDTVKVVIR